MGIHAKENRDKKRANIMWALSGCDKISIQEVGIQEVAGLCLK